jgi:ribose 5-phosphate isomerase B
MKFYIASDHAAIDLKKTVFDSLVLKGMEVVDLGPTTTESVDYPDYAKYLCSKVLEEEENMGILICGTGIGMSMAANRIKGIRAALCTHSTMAKYSRLHNDANVLCLGARVLGDELAKDIVSMFLNTGFEWGRHKRRVDKIDEEGCSFVPNSFDIDDEIKEFEKDLGEHGL